jgi:peptidoglycan hydrolase-like protein with peptidoglycan-binding domain
MIFTLINQHWLKEIQQQGSTWLSEYGYTNVNGEWISDGSHELRADELPLFDIMIVSANEYGNYVSMFIYGIDFTDEAQTISVEDLFTENVFSFVARDVSTFKAGDYNKMPSQKGNKKDKRNIYSQHFYVLDSSSIELDDLARLEQEFTIAKMKAKDKLSKIYTLARDLYYSTTNTIMGNDVAEIQELLNKTKLLDTILPINGIFDSVMDEAVRKFQSLVGDTIDGIVDEKLYNTLMNQISEAKVKLGVIVNKFGAYVYQKPSLNSNIVDTKRYREQIPIHEIVASEDNGIFQRWYKTDTGYVTEEDVYSSFYTGSVIEFPIVNYDDSGAYVTLIQSTLAEIYPEFSGVTGYYDYETQEKIKDLQEENGMYPTGIVDNNTWLLLQSLAGNIKREVSEDNYKIKTETSPGTYTINKGSNNIPSIGATISCDNDINVKTTAICLYDDGESETYSKNMTIKKPKKVSLDDFPNVFNYNPNHGQEPKQIDYFIYPYNKDPYKWSVILQ